MNKYTDVRFVCTTCQIHSIGTVDSNSLQGLYHLQIFLNYQTFVIRNSCLHEHHHYSRFLVLFGSQTGTSEEIAETIVRKLLLCGVEDITLTSFENITTQSLFSLIFHTTDRSCLNDGSG